MNILSIADIHIGSIPAKQHKRELDGLFNIIEKDKLKNKIDMKRLYDYTKGMLRNEEVLKMLEKM